MHETRSMHETRDQTLEIGSMSARAAAEYAAGGAPEYVAPHSQ